MTIQPGRAALPGTFIASSAPQIAVLGNGALDIVDVSTRSILRSIELGSSSPGGTGGGECPEQATFQPLVNQAIQMATQQNFGGLQMVLDQLLSLNLCQQQVEAVFAQLAPYLSQFYAFIPQPPTSSALFSGDAYLLGMPTYAAGVPEANGKDRAGCDSSRPINNGAVLKNGDHTGRVVFLTPAGIYPQSCSIVKPNGKILERLQFTGIANGARSHFRGNSPINRYPKKGTIRCEVEQVFITENLCWRTNNFHSRNS
jgi:hypothetical protein